MGKARFSDDFKRDAVLQITDRGYPVSEVSQRLGVSTHSLYAWKKQFSQPTEAAGGDQSAEIRQLKRELARVTEERDILKKATAYFAKDRDRDRNLVSEGEITEVSYMFSRPIVDSPPVPKVSFITRVEDLGCGVGYYE
jgi:transposase